jgi:hypothetical protein
MITIGRRCYYYNIIVISICLCLLFLIQYDFSDENLSKNPSPIKPITLDCTDDPLQQWCQNQIHLCNSSLIIFNQLFAKTHSVILQRQFAIGKRQGGEELNNVLNQPENDEYFDFKQDFIQVIYALIPNKKKTNIFLF